MLNHLYWMTWQSRISLSPNLFLFCLCFCLCFLFFYYPILIFLRPLNSLLVSGWREDASSRFLTAAPLLSHRFLSSYSLTTIFPIPSAAPFAGGGRGKLNKLCNDDSEDDSIYLFAFKIRSGSQRFFSLPTTSTSTSTKPGPPSTRRGYK